MIRQIKLRTMLAGVWALAVVLLLAGCVSVPESIKGTGEPQQNLAQIMAAPQQYVGQQARFGGKVVAVENQQATTRLEIAVMPLDSGARPIPGNVSLGRIYADVQGFLDPVDYKEHLVTVLGTVTGTVQGKIGDKPYQFLVLKVSGYQRWRLVQQLMMPPQYANPWFWGPYWGYGYGPWGWRTPFPAQVETVVKD